MTLSVSHKASSTRRVRTDIHDTAIDVYKPQDATTNPSLILQAANKPAYQRLIDNAVKFGKAKGGDINNQANAAMDRLVSHQQTFGDFPS